MPVRSYWILKVTNTQLTLYISNVLLCVLRSSQRDKLFEKIEPPKTTFGGFVLYKIR